MQKPSVKLKRCRSCSVSELKSIALNSHMAALACALIIMKITMNLSLMTMVVLILNSACSLDILGIYPYQGKSHFLVFRVFLRELANRGHNVTVISHFPENNPPENYHDISLAGSIKIIEDEMRPVERSYWTVFNVGIFLTTTGKLNCEMMLANQKVQDVIKQKSKFDVVVVEQFNSDCALGIAYKLGAPVVGTTSHVLMPWHYKRLGIPYNPSYVSFPFLEGGTKPTLFQRLERVIFDTSFKALYYFITQRSDQSTLAKYFDDIPPLEDLAREVKFLLVYHNFILTGSKLFPANVIEVGGYHIAKKKPLTGDLKKFIDDAKHGVVYICFGSIVNSCSLPKDKIESVTEAMKEFPQRFVWKWENDILLADENKLYVSSWLPQLEILGHPKTLAFFSHAGMGGTTESLNFGVPMIAMPIMGDQPSNAAAIEESGFGVQLQYRDLTKDTLVAALEKVLQPSFREKAKQLSKAWHDRPLSPLDTAVFWTEFAARHSNCTFRTAAADVPTYQYINLDIASIFIITVSSVVLAIWSVCSRLRKTKTIKQAKSKKSKRE